MRRIWVICSRCGDERPEQVSLDCHGNEQDHHLTLDISGGMRRQLDSYGDPITCTSRLGGVRHLCEECNIDFEAFMTGSPTIGIRDQGVINRSTPDLTIETPPASSVTVSDLQNSPTPSPETTE